MADRFVVDTSVFLRWYVPQIGFEHAREVRQDFLTGAVALETVDSTRFELGHVLRTKGLLGGHLTAAQYRAAVRSIDDLGITIHGTDADALERAGELATRCTLRFFDAVLVDRALQRGMPLLTSDRKLANAVGWRRPGRNPAGDPVTAVDTWLPAMGAIEERARLIGDGFGVEVALVWPLVGGSVGQEIIVGAGSRDRVSVRPDRVFQHAIRLGAGGVVFSHNHLKDTGPSAADRAVTRRLVAAGHLLGIPLVASLVVEPSATHDLVSDRTWRS